MNTSMLVIAEEHEYEVCSLEKARDMAIPLHATVNVVKFICDGQKQKNRQKAEDIASASISQQTDAIFHSQSSVKNQVVCTENMSDWVLDTCKSEQVDLVVKTGRRTENVFHKPSDWKLIRQLDCPILIASDHKWNSQPNIVATIDLFHQDFEHEQLNDEVLNWAKQWVETMDGQLHVVSCIPISRPLEELDIVEPERLERKKKPEMEKQINALLKKHGIDHFRCDIHAGPPQKIIPHVANELKADIVIMGCVGRDGAKGFWLGNTAEKVLHHLRTDCLIVKPGHA